MKIKRIASIAIIAALPFAATAEQTIVTTQTPAAVGANGTVKKAATTGPYVTNEPTVADQTHIATTAYVKGAYNDAIAAVNKVNDSKQDQLYNGNTKITGIAQDDEFAAIVDDVVRQSVNSGEFISELTGMKKAGLDTQLATVAGVVEGVNMAAAVLNDHVNESKQDKLYLENGSDIEAGVLPVEAIVSNIADTAEAVFAGVDTLNSVFSSTSRANGFDDSLTTAASVITAVAAGADAAKNYTNSKRVRIYTTWGTDTAAATTLVPFEMAQ